MQLVIFNVKRWMLLDSEAAKQSWRKSARTLFGLLGFESNELQAAVQEYLDAVPFGLSLI